MKARAADAEKTVIGGMIPRVRDACNLLDRPLKRRPAAWRL